ncbi:unnamed protein product [Chondrus crispus]|uniref:Uncharacterized protein n=1 Tax=Chondrus crispus TaxID=2769 RepID=R7QCP7_CHOCR|nr:unnamed protein product [Chondrus crispus]CDF35206.1 unnamed protein product [Chondrus crispus]|eukprot:XP_005715025.1 unnamed protein product [Chondrus crispus]
MTTARHTSLNLCLVLLACAILQCSFSSPVPPQEREQVPDPSTAAPLDDHQPFSTLHPDARAYPPPYLLPGNEQERNGQNEPGPVGVGPSAVSRGQPAAVDHQMQQQTQPPGGPATGPLNQGSAGNPSAIRDRSTAGANLNPAMSQALGAPDTGLTRTAMTPDGTSSANDIQSAGASGNAGILMAQSATPPTTKDVQLPPGWAASQGSNGQAQAMGTGSNVLSRSLDSPIGGSAAAITAPDSSGVPLY